MPSKTFSLSNLRFPIFHLFFFFFSFPILVSFPFAVPGWEYGWQHPISPVFHAVFTHCPLTQSKPFSNSCRRIKICTFHVMCSWKLYDLYLSRFPSFSQLPRIFFSDFGIFILNSIGVGKLCACQWPSLVCPNYCPFTQYESWKKPKKSRSLIGSESQTNLQKFWGGSVPLLLALNASEIFQCWNNSGGVPQHL